MKRGCSGALASFALGLSLSGACGGAAAFACQDASDCQDGDQIGVCIDSGCAFDDPECSSGLRFGELAPAGLAGSCVDGGTGATGTDPSSASEAESSPSDPTVTPSSGTTSGTAGSDTTAVPSSGSDSSGGQDTGSSCPPSWWDCAWPARRVLDVQWEGEPLVDFPVLVALTPERIDYTLAAPDGADLRFVQDGEVLAHELVSWQPDGVSEVWVRLPQLGASELGMYYGNQTAEDVSDPAQVWSNEYLAVLHMNDETDSVGTLDLTAVAVEPVPGLLGTALQFDGVSSYMQHADVLEIFAGGATVTAQVIAHGWGQNGFGRIIDSSDINTTATGYSFSLNESGDGGIQTLRFARGYVSTNLRWNPTDQSYALDTWNTLAVSFSDDAPEPPTFYLDGAAMMSNTLQPSEATVSSPLPLTIGAMGTLDLRFFDGLMDEIHIASTVRSAGWVQAEHASLTDALLSYGDEELHR